MHTESVKSHGFCLDGSIQGIIIDTEVKSHGGFVRGCHLMSFQSGCSPTERLQKLMGGCRPVWWEVWAQNQGHGSEEGGQGITGGSVEGQVDL